jgi:hypothetical protein
MVLESLGTVKARMHGGKISLWILYAYIKYMYHSVLIHLVGYVMFEAGKSFSEKRSSICIFD